MQSKRHSALALTVLLAILFPAAGLARLQSGDDSDAEPILYTKTAANDPISRLQKQIDSGQVKLEFNSAHGYLDSVLKALKISVPSQILVFSKTSFQRDLITPRQPRALYFDDNTYIGWVQGGRVLEVATVDPQLGTVFYTLNQEKAAQPKFVRQTYECLQCHTGALTGGVPGLTMRSVFTRADGLPDLSSGTYVTTDTSPMKERWGGWYVTGKHGHMRHMGNVFARGAEGSADLNMDEGANVTSLRDLIDTAPYLGKTSDIVALMVAEHQTHVQNLITKANYETRMALHYERLLNAELHRPADEHQHSTQVRVESAGEKLVKGLLFVGEEKLTDPITGTSGFAERFAAQGPFDKQGRSLRQLDLTHRLLRYPCSYLIYSEAFDALPDLMKDYIYRRLWEVTSGQDKSADFAHLTDSDRKAILDILTDTKPAFASWVAAHTSRTEKT